ncbi:MAG: hypothetical protein V3U79_12240 [Dehalococcoidia bacterium]
MRKARALRNYAVEYVDSHVVALLEMYGVGGARSIVEHASKVTMAQLYSKVLQGWRVLIEIINPDLTIDMTSALTAGDPYYEWVIRPRRL